MVSKTLTKFQNKLGTRVFNSDLGTDVTITPRTLSTSNDGGWSDGAEFSNGTPITVKGIPISNQTQRLSFEAFGLNNTGDGTCYVPYGTAINTNDLIAWANEDGDTQTYTVQEVEPFLVGNGIAALQIRCVEYNE